MPSAPPLDYTLTHTSGEEDTIPRLKGVWYDGLENANLLAVDCGAPVLADVDRFLTTLDMAVGAYTLDETTHADGLARSVTVTVTAGDTADTEGTLDLVGTDIAGNIILETLTPVVGTTVESTKAFLTLTTATGVGWVIDGSEGTEDAIEIGTGDLIGLPFAIRNAPAVTLATQVRSVLLGVAQVAVTANIDADALEECYVDASAGTYDGTKLLTAFISRTP